MQQSWDGSATVSNATGLTVWQKESFDHIEKQFTRLEAGVAALRRVQANLKAACEGRLAPTETELRKVAAASRRSSKNEQSRDGSATSVQRMNRAGTALPLRL